MLKVDKMLSERLIIIEQLLKHTLSAIPFSFYYVLSDETAMTEITPCRSLMDSDKALFKRGNVTLKGDLCY